jgi:hypothetical protein
MTNADWWARVVEARTDPEDLLPKRVWALRKGGHDAAISAQASALLPNGGALAETLVFRNTAATLRDTEH